MSHQDVKGNGDYELNTVNSPGLSSPPGYAKVDGVESANVVEEIRIPETPPPFYQFNALVRKNIAYQKRQCCTNVCQIMLPLSVIILVGGLHLYFTSLLPAGGEAAATEFHWATALPGTSVGINPFFLNFANPSKLPAVGALSSAGVTSSRPFMGNISQFLFKGAFQDFANGFIGGSTNKSRTIWVPFANEFASESALDAASVAERTRQRSIGNPAIATLRKEYLNNYGLSYDLAHQPMAQLVFQEVADNMADRGTVSLKFQIMTSGTNLTQLVYLSASMSSAFCRWLGLPVSYDPSFQSFPDRRTPARAFGDIASFLSMLAFPFALSLLLPVYVVTLVQEKEERLREMMKIMGLKLRNYWAINWIYNVGLILVVLTVFIGLGAAMTLKLFVKTAPHVYILLYLGWGLAQIGMSFVLSSFFNKSRGASVVSYLLVIFGILIALPLNFQLWGADALGNVAEAPIPFLLYPPFAFYRGIYLMGISCATKNCIQDLSGEMARAVILLWFAAIILPLIGIYLDQVLPQQFGVRKNPFFIFSCCYKPFQKAQNTVVHIPEREPPPEIEEDDDVRAERESILSNNGGDDHKVLVRNLHKRFQSGKLGKPDKIAVADLCLGLARAECFGLLGPNGAGKTTTISILTGLITPSGGRASIAGLDISKDIDKVHRLIGVCPQFDTLWPDMTVRDTLLFYTRLKGLRARDVLPAVLQSIGEVGLTKMALRQVKQLSGGERRRLSIAVALVGNPEVLFFDEPTTGLDPESRRQVWDVMLRAKLRRCVILTTHSMEEADVLCTRIGIMSRGRLQCLGTSTHLKSKFGKGYILKMTFSNPSLTESVQKFVHRILPKARTLEDFPGSASFQIAAVDLSMGKLFRDMAAHAAQEGIEDWGINQTSLEDVFLNITTEDADK